MNVAATMNPSVAASTADARWNGQAAASTQTTLQWVSPPGRLRATSLPSCDRNTAVTLHVASMLAVFVPVIPLFAAPVYVLIVWLAKRDDSPFLDDHGREVMNLMLSMVIFTIVLVITVIGILPLIAWYVAMLINMIRGAVAASRSEFFRYPMLLRLL